jgi:hypothetical protein
MATEFKLSYTGSEVNEKLGKIDGLVEAEERLTDEIAIERARINQFITLEDGSTTGDAELQDIRVGADGVTYESAGEAVRSQIGNLNSNFDEITGQTKNIFDPKYLLSIAGWTKNDGVYTGKAFSLHQNFWDGTKRYPISGLADNTRYTWSFMAKTDGNAGTTGNGIMPQFVYSDGTTSAFGCSNSTAEWTNFKGISKADKTLVAIGLTYGGNGDNIWYLKDIQIEAGEEQTDYAFPFTAKDNVARSAITNVESKISGTLAWDEIADIPWEQGNIYITASDIFYNFSDVDKRIRTPNDFVLELSAGDIISLPEDGTVNMYIAWKKQDGTYGYVGWINKTFTAELDSTYYLLAKFKSGKVLESVDELSQHITVTRTMTPKKAIDKLTERVASVEDGIDTESVVPEYFKENLQNAIQLAETNMINAGINGESFVFLSDIHWENNEKHSPILIKAVTDALPIENTIYGGDTFNGGTHEYAISIMNDVRQKFTEASPHFLAVYGNHDGNQLDGGTAFTNDEFYTLMQKQSDYYVEYEAPYYYYMDNRATKTRYIFLDSRTGTPSTASAQIAWLQSIMDSAPTGWHFIIFVHVIYYPASGGEYNDPTTWIMSPFMTDVCPILDAVNDTGNKTVEAIFGGHCHIDYNGQTSGGIPIVMIDCDTRQTVSGNPQTSGTIGEQCLDIVTVNYSAKEIHCARIGRGTSRTIAY